MACASMHHATGGSGSPSPAFPSRAALAQMGLAEVSQTAFWQGGGIADAAGLSPFVSPH